MSPSAFSPNTLCRRPARIRCEDYGKIILKRSVHRFNYETFQTLADVGRAHSSNIIVMIGDDRLNCGNFLLGSHAGAFNFLFSVGNHEWNEIFSRAPSSPARDIASLASALLNPAGNHEMREKSERECD